MVESTARCPGCGAPADADSVRCEYCGAALATVTCPACFAPMFVGSRFCARCGAEATGTRIDDGVLLNCPRCAEEMQALALGSTSVHACGNCGGLWLTPVSMQALCDARDEHAAVVSALSARVPAATLAADTVRYIPCPTCKRLMNRVNFSKSSGVIVDVCKADGAWLDRGELQRVIGFVEGGGLAVARDHERERLVDEQKRLLAMQQNSLLAHEASALTPSMAAWASGRSSSNTTVEHLLSDALGLFLK
jgi:Zn-finger nucleic acid-binding protein